MQNRSRFLRPASRFALALAAAGAILSLRCGTDEAATSPTTEEEEADGSGGEPSGEQTGGAPAESVCVPGATRECVGPAACRGGQACLKDGSGWGACDCGDTPSGGGAGGRGAAPDPEGGAGAGGTKNPVACTPVPQSGCDAGEKCSILVLTAAQTITFTCAKDGTQAEGAECALRADGTDDCEKGLFCNGLGTVPRCQPYCDVMDASTCETFCAELNITLTPGTPTPSGYGACQPRCSLLEQDCQDGDACVFLATPFPVCSEPGEVADGDDCSFYDECGVGSACILDNPAGTSSMCTPLCEATEAGSCPVEGDTCLAFPMLYNAVPEDLFTTGLCYPCALLGIDECELLTPGGCAEESDCDPLLASMGFEFTCETEAGRCVMAAP